MKIIITMESRVENTGVWSMEKNALAQRAARGLKSIAADAVVMSITSIIITIITSVTDITITDTIMRMGIAMRIPAVAAVVTTTITVMAGKTGLLCGWYMERVHSCF